MARPQLFLCRSRRSHASPPRREGPLQAQRKKAGWEAREDFSESRIVVNAPADELFEVHEVLADLEKEDVQASELVKLRYFVGMTMPLILSRV